MNNKIHKNRFIRKWIVSFLIIILLFPGFQRLVHHHHRHHFVFSNDPIGINDHEEHCEICSFNFPHYIDDFDVLYSEPESYTSILSTFVDFRIPGFFTGYQFLLRGPPLSNLLTMP